MPDREAAVLEGLESDPLFRRIARALGSTSPGECYVCGAYLAQLASGVSPGGILLACRGEPRVLAAGLERATGLRSVPGHAGSFLLVRPPSRNVTVVPMAREGIEAHLGLFTFSVTALAVDVAPSRRGQVINRRGGLEDLERGVLRECRPGAASRRPETPYVAAGLREALGLEPDAGTMNALRDASAGPRTPRPPRAWLALAGLFSKPGISGTAAFLKETGALGALLPEVEAVFDVPQNYYHHLGVWEHTLETMDLLDGIMEEPGTSFRSRARGLEAHLASRLAGGFTRRAFLAFAALVHDVGKADTMTVEPGGRIRFPGHQIEGGRLAAGIAARLGMGTAAQRHLAGIVQDHMRLGFLIEEGETTAGRLRAALEMGGHCPEVVMLSLADRMATRGEASTARAFDRYKRTASRVLADWFWLREHPLLVDGRDVTVHAGLEPGPSVARALFDVTLAQRESSISNRAEALEFLAPDFKGRMDTRGA